MGPQGTIVEFYWLAILLGAIFLIIQARAKYIVQTSESPFPDHPVLNKLSVSDLGTEKEIAAGFAFYSLFYLIVYIVLVSSTELFDLIFTATADARKVGTISFPSDEINAIFKPDASAYGRPLLIASTIIALSSAGMLSKFETAMRRMAHQIAGVPHGIYWVMERVESLTQDDLSRMAEGSEDWLIKTFEKVWPEGSAHPGIIRSRTDVMRAVYLVSVFQPALIGFERARLFPGVRLSNLSGKLQDYREKVRQMRSALSSVSEKAPGTSVEDDLASFAEQVIEAARMATALFSVCYVRNERTLRSARKERTLRDGGAQPAQPGAMPAAGIETAVWDRLEPLRQQLLRPYNIPLNALLIAMVIAFVMSFALSYATWNATISCQTQTIEADNPAAPKAGAGPSGSPAPQATVASPQQEKMPQQEQTPQQEKTQENTPQPCRPFTMNIALKMLADIATMVGSFAMAGVTALAIVAMEKDGGRWPRWHLWQPPVVLLVWTAIVPALAFTGVLVLLELVVHILDLGHLPSRSELTAFFLQKWRFFAMMPGLGLIGAMAVIALSDQFPTLGGFGTMLLTICGAVMLLVWSSLAVIVAGNPIEEIRWELVLNQAGRLAFPAAATLLVMGLIAEIIEKRSE